MKKIRDIAIVSSKVLDIIANEENDGKKSILGKKLKELTVEDIGVSDISLENLNAVKELFTTGVKLN